MLAVVTLTGCVGFGEPRPVEVSLDRTDLTVRLSDNSRCTGPVEAVRGTNGQVLVSGAGPLQNCATPLNYRVTADPGLNPLRLVFEEVFGAIGLRQRHRARRRGRTHRTRWTALGLRLAARVHGRLDPQIAKIFLAEHPSDVATGFAPPVRIPYFWKDEERDPALHLSRNTQISTAGRSRRRQGVHGYRDRSRSPDHRGQNTRSAGSRPPRSAPPAAGPCASNRRTCSPRARGSACCSCARSA
jgi:hypothetical protein